MRCKDKQKKQSDNFLETSERLKNYQQNIKIPKKHCITLVTVFKIKTTNLIFLLLFYIMVSKQVCNNGFL